MLRPEIVDATAGTPDEREDAPSRRIEGWVAGALGARNAGRGGVSLENWELGLRAPRASPTTLDSGTAVPGAGWERFKQVDQGDVTILRLLDRTLLREGELRELAEDLLCLVAAGYTKLIVNCAGIERLSSWVVGAVAAAHRRCVAADNGAVRVCGLRPEVAAAFSILGGAKGIALFADEAAAMAAPWSEPARARPLPISVLSAATTEETVTPRARPVHEKLLAQEKSQPIFRLIARGGRSDGKTVAVGPAGLRIGRDAGCNLRLASAGVSRDHAAIDWREGKAWLRDLGSTNGTFHNGVKLGSTDVALRDNDCITIGSQEMSVRFGSGDEHSDSLDESVVGWLLDGAATAVGSNVATSEDLPSLEAVDPQRIVRCDVIEGVVIIAPRASDLEDESTLGPLRAGFQILKEPPIPTRVVVNLECVMRMSEQAIGLLVAHHFRLHRAGGALRIAAASVRLMARLEQIRLPELIACYVTIDDAVLHAWPEAATEG